MRLVDAHGNVEMEQTPECSDALASNGPVDPGVYELEVWTSEESLAPTAFSVETDVDHP